MTRSGPDETFGETRLPAGLPLRVFISTLTVARYIRQARTI
jgi:hypothetical protein